MIKQVASSIITVRILWIPTLRNGSLTVQFKLLHSNSISTCNKCNWITNDNVHVYKSYCNVKYKWNVINTNLVPLNVTHQTDRCRNRWGIYFCKGHHTTWNHSRHASVHSRLSLSRVSVCPPLCPVRPASWSKSCFCHLFKNKHIQ